MASLLKITCPECERLMKVPAEARGKKIRCKGCGHAFVARGAPAPAKPARPAPKKGKAPDEEEANPYDVTHLDLAPRCPSCANEMESADAIICLHCGYNTMSRSHVGTKKVYDVTGGDQFLWLLPGILCVVAIFLLIGFDAFYLLAMRSLTNGEWFEFLGSTACQLWTVILSLFAMFYAGRFAIRRLIFDNTPPEIEKY
jgi:ribosomal protein S27E